MVRRTSGDAQSRLPRLPARGRVGILRGLLPVCWLALTGAAFAAGGGDKPDPAKEAAMKALAIRDAPKEVSAQDFVAKEPAKYLAQLDKAAPKKN